jgi:ribosomal protein S2
MNISLNINQMIFANLHVGHAVEYFDSKLKGILIGSRNRVFILDLKVSILQLSVVSNLILNLSSKRNDILVVKE